MFLLSSGGTTANVIWFLSPRILGTPSEETWPGVSSLPDYKPTFPQWSRQELSRIVPTLDDSGIDMLKVSLIRSVWGADSAGLERQFIWFGLPCRPGATHKGLIGLIAWPIRLLSLSFARSHPCFQRTLTYDSAKRISGKYLAAITRGTND